MVNTVYSHLTKKIMNKGKKFLSDLKLHNDYYKWNTDQQRYETWEEAQDSILNGHRQKYNLPELEPYLNSVAVDLKERRVLASQRNLQFRFESIQQHNMRMYNCVSQHAVNNKIFQNTCYLALCGCGIGTSLLLPFVQNISQITRRKNGTKTFVVEDSIEGWADAFGVLMSSYFIDKQPFPSAAGYQIRFDFSKVRPKGAFISGGFKAPGHEGLRQSLERVEALLEKWLDTEGPVLRPIVVSDILCHISDAVLSGGIRRAALNMIVDPNDQEMIHAKTGDWFLNNPQRARSNNSVLLLRSEVTEEQFTELLKINQGQADIGFVLANSWFDTFNPCYEILKLPVLVNTNFSKIPYADISRFVAENEHLFGQQACNLTEINAEACTTEELFLQACRSAAIIGTLQAGYTNFPYLGEITEALVKRESLLGVSITGWFNNMNLFDAKLLERGAELVKRTNEEIASLIGINPAARTTTVKPSGNASVVLGTASGAHAEHSQRYFRVMQLAKETEVAQYLQKNMPFLLEESVYSPNNRDYAVFIPVENPELGLYKEEVKGVTHLQYIKLIQQHWVKPGTNEKYCVYPGMNHNVSCTIEIDDFDKIIQYIWDNKTDFTAVSFWNNADYNQSPFTTVKTLEEILKEYGDAAIFASGLIVDGLHYFNDNLWDACESALNKDRPLTGTREQVLLKKYWISRCKKFARNFLKNNITHTIELLKAVHLFHKWKTINRQFKEVDISKILTKPEYKSIGDYAAIACSGGSCEITR